MVNDQGNHDEGVSGMLTFLPFVNLASLRTATDLTLTMPSLVIRWKAEEEYISSYFQYRYLYPESSGVLIDDGFQGSVSSPRLR